MQQHSFLLFFFVLFFSCTKEIIREIPQEQHENKPNSGDSGGMDSSGGNRVLADRQDIDDALSNLSTKSSIALYRLAVEFALYPEKVINAKYGPDSHWVLKKFFLLNRFKLGHVLNSIKNNKIPLELLDSHYCQSRVGHRDASSQGHYPHGKICISKLGFFQDSPYSLESQVSGLYIHELAHLFHLNEQEAQTLQRIIFKGGQYFFTNPLFEKTITEDFNQISLIVRTIHQYPDSIEMERFCRDINTQVERNERIIGRMSLVDGAKLLRVVPDYIEYDFLNILNLLKGLRAYCGIQPFSTISRYNVPHGNKNSLVSQAKQASQYISSVKNRLEQFFRPDLSFGNNTRLDGLVSNFDQFVRPRSNQTQLRYPRECYLASLRKNQTFFTDGHDIIYQVGHHYCSVSSQDGDVNYHMIPVYWKNGTKLPHHIRKKLDKLFYHKIIELKIKEQLGIVLSYLTQFLTQTPKVYKLVTMFGDASKSPALGPEILRKALIDVFIQYSSDPTTSKKDLAVILYYAITKAKEFKAMSVTSSTLQVIDLFTLNLENKKTYNQKYLVLNKVFDQLGLF